MGKNDLLLYGGIVAAAAGFLFLTEPGKNILRSLDQLQVYGRVVPGLDTAAEVRAFEQGRAAMYGAWVRP